MISSLNKLTDHSLLNFPISTTDKIFLYPSLSLYILTSRTVKTVVGVIFTALSLLTFGVCKPINNLANWTRNSKGLLTIPLNIIKNIFQIEFEFFNEYHKKVFYPCEKGVNRIMQEGLENYNEYFEDIYLRRAEQICTSTFDNKERNKTDLITKHLVFRVGIILNAFLSFVWELAGAGIGLVMNIPFLLIKGISGRKENFNSMPLNFLKLPILVHQVALSARMFVNPLQFVENSEEELKLNDLKTKDIFKLPFEFFNNISIFD